MAGLLAYVIIGKRRNAGLVGAGTEEGPDLELDRARLVREIAMLDDLYESGGIELGEYHAKRDELKSLLMQRHMDSGQEPETG